MTKKGDVKKDPSYLPGRIEKEAPERRDLSSGSVSSLSVEKKKKIGNFLLQKKGNEGSILGPFFSFHFLKQSLFCLFFFFFEDILLSWNYPLYRSLWKCRGVYCTYTNISTRSLFLTSKGLHFDHPTASCYVNLTTYHTFLIFLSQGTKKLLGHLPQTVYDIRLLSDRCGLTWYLYKRARLWLASRKSLRAGIKCF